MKRSPRIIAVIVLSAVQMVAIATYLYVQRERNAATAQARVTDATAPRAVSQQLRKLQVERPDGTQLDLATLSERTVVHVWATWCPPCRDELPALAAWATRTGTPLVAISLDPEWQTIRDYAPNIPEAYLARASNDAMSELKVTTLPVTVLVEPTGVVRLRADGARDWTDKTFADAWSNSSGTGR